MTVIKTTEKNIYFPFRKSRSSTIGSNGPVAIHKINPVRGAQNKIVKNMILSANRLHSDGNQNADATRPDSRMASIKISEEKSTFSERQNRADTLISDRISHRSAHERAGNDNESIIRLSLSMAIDADSSNIRIACGKSKSDSEDKHGLDLECLRVRAFFQPANTAADTNTRRKMNKKEYPFLVITVRISYNVYVYCSCFSLNLNFSLEWRSLFAERSIISRKWLLIEWLEGEKIQFPFSLVCCALLRKPLSKCIKWHSMRNEPIRVNAISLCGGILSGPFSCHFETLRCLIFRKLKSNQFD